VTDAQRCAPNALRQANLHQISIFLPFLLTLPSKCNFSSPLDLFYNEMTFYHDFALYTLHFNLSSFQNHFSKVLVTFSKTLFFSLKFDSFSWQFDGLMS